MNWPSQEFVLALVGKTTIAFGVALLLERAIKSSLPARRWLWTLCFLLPLWFCVPIEGFKVPILAPNSESPLSGNRVLELESGFASFKTTYGADPGPSLALLVFGSVAVVGLLVLALRLFATLKTVRSADQVTDESLIEQLYEIGQRHGLSDAPLIKVSDAVDSPCVWGVLHPVILVPSRFHSLSHEEWGLVLGHELCHLARRDPLRVLCYSLVQYAFWWNPLVWMGMRQALLAQELSVDSSFSGSTAYARLLGKMAPATASGTSLRFLGEGHLLTRIKAATTLVTPGTNKASMFAFLAFLPIVVPFRLTPQYHPQPGQIGFDEIVFLSNRAGKMKLWRMTGSGDSPSPLSLLFTGIGVHAVSPDGRFLAYTRLRDGKEDIFVANIDGTDERLLVSTPERDVQPIWSPNGRLITFCTLATGSWEVAVADSEKGIWRYVTHDGKKNLESSWHPNGERLVFSSHRSGSQKLWSMNLDGSGLVQLTFDTWEDTHGRYSRDGRLVVFSSLRRAKYDVCVLDLSNGSVRPLTAIWLIDGGEPQFVDGGRSVVMTANDGQKPFLATIELDAGELRRLNLPGDNLWPVGR